MTKKDKGFTLVELLVVMGIMAVLIAIAVAGLAFAMRRSRNTARQSSVDNLDKALSAYYTENEQYPTASSMEQLIETELDEFLEGSWDGGASNSIYCYKPGDDNLLFVVCASQEEFSGDDTYFCKGTGMGQDGFPSGSTDNATPPTEAVCNSWDGDDWGSADTGDPGGVGDDTKDDDAGGGIGID